MWQRLPSTDHTGSQLADGSPHPSQLAAAEFTLEERAALLRVAHEAITAAVENRAYSPADASADLSAPRGVFTTLYRGDHLRGCVGFIHAVRPLLHAVAETAQSAAMHDTRFAAVEVHELAEIRVSLSILSPIFPIKPHQIEIGRHGLVIRHDRRRGLLLPQVATEHGWDAETFLEQTCFKAGLPGDAWKQGAQIEAFTAEIFGDAGLHQP
jgi:AmmeMemoRadiSam system protein A